MFLAFMENPRYQFIIPTNVYESTCSIFIYEKELPTNEITSPQTLISTIKNYDSTVFCVKFHKFLITKRQCFSHACNLLIFYTKSIKICKYNLLPLENMFTFTIPARPNLKEGKSKITSGFTLGVYSEYTPGFRILACTQSEPKLI